LQRHKAKKNKSCNLSPHAEHRYYSSTKDEVNEVIFDVPEG